MKLVKTDVAKMIGIVYLESGQSVSEHDIKERVDFWYASLKQFEREIVLTAFQNVAMNTNYPVKLADVCNEIRRLQALGEKSDEQLWVELTGVLDKVRHNTEGYRYDYMDEGARCRKSNEQIYAALPPEIKDYLRSISELITVAYMSSEDLRYEKARFMKRIGEIREQARLRRETPKEVLELFAGAVPQITEGK